MTFNRRIIVAMAAGFMLGMGFGAIKMLAELMLAIGCPGWKP